MENKIDKTENEEETSQWKDFFGNTSLHGVRYLIEKGFLRRLVWIAALGVAFGFCGWQVSKTVTAFMAKPFSSTLTVERNQTAMKYFPAVTICNMNKISMKQYVLESKELGMSNENATAEQLREQIMTIMTLMTYYSNESEMINAAKKEFYAEPIFRRKDDTFGKALNGFSHTIEGMLSFDWLGPCKWKGQKCTEQNFSSFLNLQMGKCYTFNSGLDGHPLLENSQVPGPLQGLRLKLNVEEEHHITDFGAPMAGFKILIHDQKEYPLIGDFGFAIQPGTHTFAAVSVTKYQNLASPFKTNCRSPDTLSTKYFKRSYSQQLCIKQCLHEYYIEKCGCQPLFNITSGVQLCSMQDAFECVFPSLYQKLPPKVSSCSLKCPRPCQLTKYDVKLSYASALSNSFSRTLPAFVKTLDPERQKELVNVSTRDLQIYLSGNLASIDIYFEDLSYTYIQQKPIFDTWALFANVGGYTGLFLGMSILTVLEFIDFLFMWLLKAIFKPSKKQKVENGKSSRNKNEYVDDKSIQFETTNKAFSMNEQFIAA